MAPARALLKDAEILVLDEATSDLDSNWKSRSRRQSRVWIASTQWGIAHRLSTVKNADWIYTVDAGEIIEDGEHEKLIANEGQYAELYAIQSKSA